MNPNMKNAMIRWVNQEDLKIDPWPKTALANILGVGYAGVPFWLEDYETIKHLPGIVTRLDLSRVWPCCDRSAGHNFEED